MKARRSPHRQPIWRIITSTDTVDKSYMIMYNEKKRGEDPLGSYINGKPQIRNRVRAPILPTHAANSDMHVSLST